jgi:hypothetical protein
MSKKIKGSSKKRSYDEYDLVEEPVAKPHKKVILSSDDDAVESRPGSLPPPTVLRSRTSGICLTTFGRTNSDSAVTRALWFSVC